MTVRRVRKDFGVPVTFKDRNVNDAKDGLIDCVAYEDKTFELQKLELDKGTQVCKRENKSDFTKGTFFFYQEIYTSCALEDN